MDTDTELDCGDALDVLMGYGGAFDAGNLPSGWTVEAEHFYGGAGITITAPNGQKFIAIIQPDEGL